MGREIRYLLHKLQAATMFSNTHDLLSRNIWCNDWPDITKICSQACEIWYSQSLHIANVGSSSSSAHHRSDMFWESANV